MAFALAVLSLVIALLSVFGVLQPLALVSFIRQFMAKRKALWVAVAVRLVLAMLLWVTASVSHTPMTFKVLACLTLVAAVVLPLIGRDRIAALLDWVASWRTFAIRLWCLLGVGFGGFLFWSVSASWTLN